MKTILIAMLAFAGTLAAQTTPAAPNVSITAAADQADKLAVKAVMSGDLKNAQAWTEVSLKIRAGQYLAPFGELAAQFKDHLKNAPAFITAGMRVESAKPVVAAYQNKYETQAVMAIISNDPAAFEKSLARAQAWNALMRAEGVIRDARNVEMRRAYNALPYEEQKKKGYPDENMQPTPSQLSEVLEYIETGKSSEYVSTLTANADAWNALQLLKPMLLTSN